MTRISLDSLHEDPDNHPPQDETFVNLLVAAVEKEIDVHWAGIHLPYLRPFSPNYKPVSWEPWKSLLDSYKERFSADRFQPLLVYQVGDFFVVSDDYAAYYAYLETLMKLVPCYILGEPNSTHIYGLRRATEEEFRSIAGM